MSRVLINILFTILSTQTYSQYVTIVDAETYNPLPLATLYDQEESEAKYTDQLGRIYLSKLNPKSNYSISHLGYEDLQVPGSVLIAATYISLQPKPMSLEQVVISANRWTTSNSNNPIKVSKLTRSNITQLNAQTSADMLGKHGEVFIQKSQQGGGSPMIRGFAANRLLYSFDGVRMNTAIFRSGNLQNILNIDPFAISQAEVIFGPGSVMYGSDAIGGVMAFRSLQFRENQQLGHAAVRYATVNDEKSIHGDVSYKLGKLNMVTSLTYNQYGDLRMGAQNGYNTYLNRIYTLTVNGQDSAATNPNPLVQINSGFNQFHALHSIEYQVCPLGQLKFTTYYSTTSDYGRTDRLVQLRNGIPKSAVWNYGPQTWWFNTLQYSYNGATKWYDQTRVQLSTQFFNESRKDRNFGSKTLNYRDEKVWAYSLNLDYLKKLTARSQLTYGLESVYNKVASQGASFDVSNNTQKVANPRYPNSTWQSHAAFATIEQELSPKLNISSGLRLNYYHLNSTFDTSLFLLPFTEATLSNLGISVSLGSVYKPTGHTWIRLQLSTGFRSPNVDDIGKIFDSSPGSVVVPNPNLRAENTYNVDLGWEQIIGKKVKLSLNGFYSNLLGGIVRRNYTYQGQDSILYDGTLSQVQSNINAAKIIIYGFNGALECKIGNGWNATFKYNYQIGEEELEDGTINPARHAAPAFGIIQLQKSIKNWTLASTWHYNAKVAADKMPLSEIERAYLYPTDGEGNPFTPAWYTFNFNINYRFAKGWRIQLDLENMLDRQYRVYSSGLVAGGRNISLLLGYSF